MIAPPHTTAMSSFTLKAAVVGVVLSLVVAMYSAYAGLKVGGVYWPIITATLMAMALLRGLGVRDKKQICVAATAASTGGLLAAGVIFTLPALRLLGLPLAPLETALVALVGGLLGVLFTAPLREEMIERLALPYPDGTATARVLEAGDEGGKSVRTLAWAGLAAGLVPVLRDRLGWLPAAVNLDSLGLSAARRFSFGTTISLVSLAGGYLIGPIFTGAWLAGGVVSYLIAVPWLLAGGGYADKGAAIAAVTRPFGIGVIVGASLTYFLVRGLPSFIPLLGRAAGAGKGRAFGWLGAVSVVVVVVSWALELPLAVTLLAVAGAFVVAYIAARIAGELNIDPMEIFAIALLLLVLLFVRLEPRQAVFFAAVLCLSAGMAGDFMQDLKAGSLVGARPRDQVKAQVLSVFVAAAALGPILLALDRAYGLGSVDLPAPQAVALSELVRAGGITGPLAWGGALGAVLTLASLPLGLGMLPVAFGIGLYAPIELSVPLFLGGLLRLVAERRGSADRGRLLAAGAIGGEGLVGVTLALISLASGR